jgi:cytochrome c
MNILLRTIFIASLIICFFVFNIASPFIKRKLQGQNHVPVVKIIKPKNDSAFALNTLVGYSISISDREDGDSRFDEINNKEVLLQVKYLEGMANMPQTGNSGISDAKGLVLIRTSNCFNCHNFSSKGIGPSFYDIVQKYPVTPENIAAVAKRVKDGSTGIWGKVAMPTHPELTGDQAQTIVDWILHYSAAPGTDYYIGAQGVFKLKQPADATAKGVYLLTATYIDHGLKPDSANRLEGSDMMLVRGK